MPRRAVREEMQRSPSSRESTPRSAKKRTFIRDALARPRMPLITCSFPAADASRATPETGLPAHVPPPPPPGEVVARARHARHPHQRGATPRHHCPSCFAQRHTGEVKRRVLKVTETGSGTSLTGGIAGSASREACARCVRCQVGGGWAERRGASSEERRKTGCLHAGVAPAWRLPPPGGSARPSILPNRRAG